MSFPAPVPARGYAFREVARRHGDFAIVACAAVAMRPACGWRSAALRPTGRDDLPARSRRQRARRCAQRLSPASLDARDDVHATARYRRDLVRQIGRSVLEEAMQCRA